jgi:hypothetical protein
MKAATLNELKHELSHLPAEELLDLCTRLARFKKENKELLTFLLFEAHDERSYIVSVKESIASGDRTKFLKTTIYISSKKVCEKYYAMPQNIFAIPAQKLLKLRCYFSFANSLKTLG